jgi:rhomboid protease GluP
MAPAADDRSFAVYLAKQFVASAGFRPGTVPEAEALQSAADIVLSGMDGLSFTTICIVDRERDSSRQFSMPRDEVEAIGRACAKYSGGVSGVMMPAAIRIIEVGREPAGAAQAARLGVFRRDSFFTHCALSAWVVDTAARTVWTTSPFGGRFDGRPFIERLLREPRMADHQMRPSGAALQEPATPIATRWLLALLAVVFVAEQLLAIGPSHGFSPSVRTLTALGGLAGNLVAVGEWWRMLSYALLHGSPLHILFNGLALWMAGHFLESLVGRAWFLALFALGAVGGAAMSLAVNPPDVLTVGASGAIMALLGAAFVASFRLPKGPRRAGIQVALVQMLVPSLLPMAFGAGASDGLHVDYGAHLGGVLTGAAAGLAMTRFWPHDEPLPRLRGIAVAITLAAVAVVATAGLELARLHGTRTTLQQLIPDDEMPGSRYEEPRRVRDLLRRYPHDPRAHAMMARYLREDEHDFAGAERELRAALAEKATLDLFEPDMTRELQASLALVLADQHRGAEARRWAALACGDDIPGSRPLRELRRRGLCEADAPAAPDTNPAAPPADATPAR